MKLLNYFYFDIKWESIWLTLNIITMLRVSQTLSTLNTKVISLEQFENTLTFLLIPSLQRQLL